MLLLLILDESMVNMLSTTAIFKRPRAVAVHAADAAAPPGMRAETLHQDRRRDQDARP
jgi:hypothetical protein